MASLCLPYTVKYCLYFWSWVNIHTATCTAVRELGACKTQQSEGDIRGRCFYVCLMAQFKRKHPSHKWLRACLPAVNSTSRQTLAKEAIFSIMFLQWLCFLTRYWEQWKQKQLKLSVEDKRLLALKEPHSQPPSPLHRFGQNSTHLYYKSSIAFLLLCDNRC